jgi:hypothetical protein
MRLAATAATAPFRASSPATAPGFLLAAAPKFTDAGEFETAREREDGRDGFEPLGSRERPAIHPVRALVDIPHEFHVLLRGGYRRHGFCHAR